MTWKLLALLPLIQEALLMKAMALEVVDEVVKGDSSADNGIWTNYDWVNTDWAIGVKNGIPYGTSTSSNQRIVAAMAQLGDESNYAASTNV